MTIIDRIRGWIISSVISDIRAMQADAKAEVDRASQRVHDTIGSYDKWRVRVEGELQQKFLGLYSKSAISEILRKIDQERMLRSADGRLIVALAEQVKASENKWEGVRDLVAEIRENGPLQMERCETPRCRGRAQHRFNNQLYCCECWVAAGHEPSDWHMPCLEHWKRLNPGLKVWGLALTADQRKSATINPINSAQGNK